MAESLKNSGHRPAQLFQIAPDILSVDTDASFLQLIKTAEQTHKSRLSAAVCPYNGYLFPLSDLYRHMVKGSVHIIGIGKGNIFKGNVRFPVDLLRGVPFCAFFCPVLSFLRFFPGFPLHFQQSEKILHIFHIRKNADRIHKQSGGYRLKLLR